ncbi:helix-turn-helix transcriptional regulator [Pseudoalteromonas sp. T1lg65]|uniref:helix-turn-helix transcriptional regulator n=1 Tax=Pseudoalteromonas sp. T1lg65 TaxID=2077101 RepID=UPI003F79D052
MKSGERNNKSYSVKRDIQASIRKLRQGVNLSQNELAKKMSTPVDQSTISNWESGKTDITVWQLLDILMICGKDWSTYFGLLQSKKLNKEEKREVE